MSAHTPEPWEVEQQNLNSIIILDANGNEVAARIVDADEITQADLDLMVRIVACVNGCAGKNPEAFDDLLAAAKFTLLDFEHRKMTAESSLRLERLRAAIAKAKP